MKGFTDIFIRRPVLATVVSLMILVFGLRSAMSLPVREYPRTENAVVTVNTTYYGADPDVVAGFITTPLETAIAQTNGIDYMTSSSQSGTSTISVYLRLNYDSDKALTEISTKVNSVLNELPSGTQQPVLTLQIGQNVDSMYICFYSDGASGGAAPNQITDYLVRVVQPRIQAVPGVQMAEIEGGKNFALRAWLDPVKLAAYGLTATDVSAALAANDYIAGVGTTRGMMVQQNLTASTNLHSQSDFENLVLKQTNNAIVRLKDVGKVTLGYDDYDSQTNFLGKRGVFIGIQLAPTANILEVLRNVTKVFHEIAPQLPPGIKGDIGWDGSRFVTSSIREVQRTLVQAALIVTLVVFAFLGSIRSVFIPAVTIPLSLVGTFGMMLLFGFSINLLTLLALVLAIGLVVDDAIIVVENVNRHMDEGMSPMKASILAARELAGPIVAMTAVLAAVYVPIGFQSGLTGALFTEFAFTLVGAVTVSAIIALTLSPMMCSRLLKPHISDHGWQDRLITFIDHRFEDVRRLYQRQLHGSLDFLPVTATFALIVLGSIYFLYNNASSELAPSEDEGFLLNIATAAPNATLEQREIYGHEIWEKLSKLPEMANVFQIDRSSMFGTGLVLKAWDERSRTAEDIRPEVQNALNQVTGLQIATLQPPPLPGSGKGLPLQFVIGTSRQFQELDSVADAFLQEATKSGMFAYIDKDLRINQPQSVVKIDRDKAATLGLKMSDIGSAMATMLGGGYVNYFSLDNRSYKVIPQVQQRSRLNADQLLNYYIKAADGTPIPLSTVASIETRTIPQSLNHFQQLNEATIEGVPASGVALGDAIEYLQKLAKRTLPQDYSVDYGGLSRQYIQESSGFVTTFAFALIVVFLALAALFESFRDPIIILVSVPMSIAGALAFISLGVGGVTLNIYTEVGLVTLMGLISKHGILIVEFANELQARGRSKRAAIEEAAAIRLRPILMTTAAMVLGVIPLITATGAGANSRFSMGLVISTGIAIGTAFTLFVVPAVYLLIAADHSKRAEAEDAAAAGAIGA